VIQMRPSTNAPPAPSFCLIEHILYTCLHVFEPKMNLKPTLNIS
jgi:hypothetical protein